MSIDHAITLDGSLNWRLICAHAPGEFYSADEDGTKVSDDCWVRSHFENLHPSEIISEDADWGEVTTLPIPVAVEGTGWDGVMLVPVNERRAT
jgi:hypothetical protein